MLREQSILGMLCWLLYKAFPSEEECLKHKYEDFKFGNLEDEKMTTLDKFTTSLFNVMDKSQKIKKLEETTIKKKFHISREAYKLLKLCCYHNEKNQEYVFKFINYYEPHVGNAGYVTEALDMCLQNERILKNMSGIGIFIKHFISK